MDELQFLEQSKEILNDMLTLDLSHLDSVCQKIKPVRIYMEKNKDSKSVQDFILILVDAYKRVFFNQELIDALSIPNHLGYLKQIKIFENLPDVKYKLFTSCIPRLINMSSNVFWNPYLAFPHLLNKYSKEDLSNPYLQAILYFVENNKCIMNGGKDDYYDLDKEIALLKLSQQGTNFRELEEFGKRQENYGRNYLDPYINKRIGNIGELYAYNSIQKHYPTIFVSRDIKDGFGYDIYYLEDNRLENLVEVKTTNFPRTEDHFLITKNEYETMINVLTKNNARYIIYRVTLDEQLKASFRKLVLRNKNLLVDMTNKNIEYEVDQGVNGEYFALQSTNKKYNLTQQ